jgi:hypothetical protein
MRIMAITDEETVLTIAFGRLVGSKTRFKQAFPAICTCWKGLFAKDGVWDPALKDVLPSYCNALMLFVIYRKALYVVACPRCF